MKFFMSGQKFVIDKEPISVTRVKAFLDKAKPGELFTAAQLSVAARVHLSQITCLASTYTPEYYTQVKHKNFFGNPATIKQFKKELQLQCPQLKK